MSRPRLLLAVTDPMTVDLLMRGQLTALRERGFEVGVLSSPGPRLKAVAQREKVRVFPVRMRREIAPLSDAAALVRTVSVLRQFRPHIVNASTPKAGTLVAIAARLAGVPRVLYTVRGLRLETAQGLKRLVLLLSEKLAARSAHRILCVSSSLRRRYLELALAPADKVTIVGAGSSNGVDVERFRPARGSEDDDLRAALNLPRDAPVVGFVGRFTRDKGIADLAEAFFSHLLPNAPDTHLLLVGDWEDDDPVDPEVRRRLENDPRVILPGFLADSAPLYRVMTVLAFPSYREGFPNAPLEAAASGVPVVGYAATGTVDAVVDGETGRLVPIGDTGELAAALTEYLSDRAERQRHGSAARRRVAEHFNHNAVWERWAELYTSELSAGGVVIAPDPTEGNDL